MISAWSRLRVARLRGIDVVWREDDDDPLEFPEHGFCFLGLNGTVDIASEDISLVWDSSETCGYPTVPAPADLLPPGYWWDDLTALLVKRDRTLFHPSVTSATILVSSESVRQVFQSLIDGYDGEVPACLKVVVREW